MRLIDADKVLHTASRSGEYICGIKFVSCKNSSLCFSVGLDHTS